MTPAGWYADPHDPRQQRWWDGAAWTEHTAPAAPPADPSYQVMPPGRPRLPDGARIYPVWIWLVTLLPLANVVASLLWNPTLRTSELYGVRQVDPASIYTLGYFLVLLLGLLVSAAFVVFAWLDWRGLKHIGVQRPFHWAFAFLGIVYPIGRAVVVHSVAKPRGLTTIWVLIGVEVISVIAAVVHVGAILSQFSSALSG